jgi:hypothetical protein
MALTAGTKQFGADMAGPYVITTPVKGQPIPAVGFGQAVKDAITDLDSRVNAVSLLAPLYDQRTSDAATITNTTLVSVLQVTLPAVGTYVWDLQSNFTHPTNTGKPGFALGGTCTPTAWRWTSGTVAYQSIGSAAGGAHEGFNASGTTFPGSTSGQAFTNSNFTNSGGFSWMSLKGTITISAIGTLQFRFSELVASGFQMKAGSMVTVSFVG